MTQEARSVKLKRSQGARPQVRMNLAEVADLDEACGATGLSRSDFIRQAVNGTARYVLEVVDQAKALQVRAQTMTLQGSEEAGRTIAKGMEQ